MRLKRFLPLLVLGAAVAIPAASAGTGTFSGTVTATACGPLHPIQVATGDTTIDVTESPTLAANDTTIDLYDPSGTLKAHGDTLTSPESLA